jgi:hypothetical protein
MVVTITTGTPPALIAFRPEASTAWQTLDVAGKTSFEVTATGPYHVAVVCEEPSPDGSDLSVAVLEQALTLADGPMIDSSCFSSASSPFVISGTVTEPGEVWLGDFGTAATAASWDFALPARDGTFDFIELFGDLFTQFDRIAIRRDVRVAGDMDLGVIDAQAENAQTLIPLSFTAMNRQPDESLSHTSRLYTNNTVAFTSTFGSDGDTWTARLVPDRVLVATDRQSLSLRAASETTHDTITHRRSRSVNLEPGPDPSTSIMLPEPLEPVVYDVSADRLTAKWSSLPASHGAGLWRESFSESFEKFRYHELRLSPDFIATVGPTSAALDFRDIPGFKPGWQHDPADRQSRGFFASSASSSSPYSWTSVSESDDFEPVPPAPTASSARNARDRFDGRLDRRVDGRLWDHFVGHAGADRAMMERSAARARRNAR